ncbi:hypothetical protein Tco_0327038 [Tanacetum coccineum]
MILATSRRLSQSSVEQISEPVNDQVPPSAEDAPEFCEFFEINDLKAQLQAKTTLICNLKNQIKSGMNKLGKGFANVVIKNELRKLKGNSVDTKFTKPSILGKPVLQPPRNQSVVRQPNAFTSERPRISRNSRDWSVLGSGKNQCPNWFASQVDEKNDLSKIVTPHYLPKVRESAAAKPPICSFPQDQKNNPVEPKNHTHNMVGGMDRTKGTSVNPFKGKALGVGTQKKTDISYVRSSRNSNLMNMFQMTFGQNSSSLVLHQKMFGQNSSGLVLHFMRKIDQNGSNLIRWQKRIFLHLNLQDEMNRSFIAQNSYRLERETFSKIYRSCRRILSSTFQLIFQEHKLRKAHEALAGPDPEPMKEDQTGSDSGKLHVSLAGPNPEHMDDEFLATAYPKVHENLKLITDERVIDDNPESHSGSMSSMKNLEDTDNFGDQFLYDKPTEDDQEKSKVVDESDSTILDPSHQTVTSTPPITPFIALQLRVARLEQEMSEVKKSDHSTNVLASIKSQVPTAVDKYLGTKLDDALLKVLKRHTADLIEKYSVLPGPESIQNQESEKSPKEIIRIKREQGEEKQDSTN